MRAPRHHSWILGGPTSKRKEGKREGEGRGNIGRKKDETKWGKAW